MMGELPQIGMLWMRGALSYLEQLCIQSFLDIGHHVVLYHYGEVERVPQGVEFRDANEILTEEGYLLNEMTGSPALHSDLFRYRLLDKREGMIWADTDAYCRKPFETQTGYFFGWESDKGLNGGVLGLPRDSLALKALLDFTRDEYAIPKWYKKSYIQELEEARDAGNPIHVGKQPWGVWGPHALSYFLKETGEVKYALPREGLYPYSFHDRRKIVKPRFDPSNFVKDNTLSIHLYGRRMRKFLAEGYPGVPDHRGLLGQLLIKHKINPIEAPLRDFPNPDPDGEFAKEILLAIGARPTSIAPARSLPKEVTSTTPQDNPPSPVTHHPANPEPAKLTTVVAVTTMRDEGPYILDWIAYHIWVGFTHFLVFTNDCRDGTDAILDALAARGLVTRVDNPAQIEKGERPQRVALKLAQAHPIVQAADAYMVFDVDEYLNIHTPEGSLQSLFSRTGNPSLISATWRFFGSSGNLNFEDAPMPLTCTKCAPEMVRFPHHNWGFKTLVRQPSIFGTIGIHRPLDPVETAMPHWVNGSGKQMPDKYYDKGWRSSLESWGYDLVTLNHYAIRSLDGFLQKRDRGRTNHINRDQGVHYWNVHNRNDTNDTRMLEKFPNCNHLREMFRSDPVIGPLHAQAVQWHKTRIELIKNQPAYHALHNVLSQNIMSHTIPEDDESLDGNLITSASLADRNATPPPERNTDSVANTPANPVSTTGSDISINQNVPAQTTEEVQTGERALATYQTLEKRMRNRFPMLSPSPSKISREKITLVTTMRDEAPFILEWVAYHLSIGVTNFLVYTNDCLDETDAILDRLGALGYVAHVNNPFDAEKGQKPQRGALNDAVNHPLIQESDWYMCMDVDEFINIRAGDGTISALIDAMNQPNAISMIWRFFGNAGIVDFEDRFICEQFLHCAPYFIPKPRMGWGFKTLVHKSAPFSKLGVHRPLNPDTSRLEDVRWVNGSGHVMPSHFPESNGWRATKRTLAYGMVYLNHYALRSAESYLVKRARGRVNHVDEDMGLYYWRRRNYISEIDESILPKVSRAKKIMKRLLQDDALAKLHQSAVSSHKARIDELKAQSNFQELFTEISKIPQEDAIFMKERHAEDFDGEQTED